MDEPYQTLKRKNSNETFKDLHAVHKTKFSKTIFYKFYKAVRDEIMKVEAFRFSQETWKAIIELFRTKPGLEEYYRVFDLAMQELYEHNVGLYLSMIRYLFNPQHDDHLDEELDIYEFYALCDEEKEDAPWMKDGDYVERALKFSLDTYYSALDEYIERVFKASKDDFEKLLNYCIKREVTFVDVYSQAIKECVRNGAFGRAFVYVAKNLYFDAGFMVFRKGNRLVIRKGVSE